jgi:hypothetical protein
MKQLSDRIKPESVESPAAGELETGQLKIHFS